VRLSLGQKQLYLLCDGDGAATVRGERIQKRNEKAHKGCAIPILVSYPFDRTRSMSLQISCLMAEAYALGAQQAVAIRPIELSSSTHVASSC